MDIKTAEEIVRDEPRKEEKVCPQCLLEGNEGQCDRKDCRNHLTNPSKEMVSYIKEQFSPTPQDWRETERRLFINKFSGHIGNTGHIADYIVQRMEVLREETIKEGCEHHGPGFSGGITCLEQGLQISAHVRLSERTRIKAIVEEEIAKRIGPGGHGPCCMCTNCKQYNEDCTCSELELLKPLLSRIDTDHE